MNSGEAECPEKKQRDVARAMVRSELTLAEILAAHSVKDEEFIEWIRDGSFTEYAASLARGFAEAGAPHVWKTLLDLVDDGSVSAIRLYFDVINKKPTVQNGADRTRFAELEGLRSSVFAEGDFADG